MEYHVKNAFAARHFATRTLPPPRVMASISFSTHSFSVSLFGGSGASPRIWARDSLLWLAGIAPVLLLSWKGELQASQLELPAGLIRVQPWQVQGSEGQIWGIDGEAAEAKGALRRCLKLRNYSVKTSLSLLVFHGRNLPPRGGIQIELASKL